MARTRRASSTLRLSPNTGCASVMNFFSKSPSLGGLSGRMPYPATYLGHKSIRSTLVYLNITPELLQQASERYRRSGARALRASGGRS